MKSLPKASVKGSVKIDIFESRRINLLFSWREIKLIFIFGVSKMLFVRGGVGGGIFEIVDIVFQEIETRTFVSLLLNEQMFVLCPLKDWVLLEIW